MKTPEVMHERVDGHPHSERPSAIRRGEAASARDAYARAAAGPRVGGAGRARDARPRGGVVAASDPIVLSVNEAAALAHCGPRAIHSLIRRGLVPAIKVGPWYRIARRPFLAYLERGDATLIEDA